MSNRQAQSRRAFEELAARRGYDLEHNGHTYANQLTNDAFAMYEAGRRQRSPVQEAGPWTAGHGQDGTVYVQSDDFTHDVMLRVSGCFATENGRLAYAEELARRLNRACANVEQPDGDIPYEKTRSYFLALAKIVQGLGLREEQNLVHAPALVAKSVLAYVDSLRR